jgi:hypothetical protein
MKKLSIKTESILVGILLAVSVAISVFCFNFVMNKISYPYVEAKAHIYLCIKYKANPLNIKLVDHKNAHPYFRDTALPIPELKWDDFSFEYTYKGRNFFVNRFDGKLYDDYQLEDIEKWGTEWLQQNVDEHITGFRIDTYLLVNYYKYTDTNRYNCLSQKRIGNFLNSFTLNSGNNNSTIYFFDENLKGDYDKVYTKTIYLYSKIHEKILLRDDVHAKFTEYNIKKDVSNSSEDKWITYYYDY